MNSPMSVMTITDMNKATPQDTLPADKTLKSSLVELNNGKLVFKQKILSFEKMSETMQEIVKFREMLEERLAAKESPLCTVPDDHKPVIAKLVHESDKTLQALSKHIQQELLPATDEDEEEDTTTPVILPVETVESAIKSVAKRVNYGLDNPSEGGKVPAAWLIWRWEVVDICRDWLPKTAKEKVDNRWRERQQVKNDVKALFESLSEEARTAVLGSKASSKASSRLKSGTKNILGTDVIDLTEAIPIPDQPSQAKTSDTNVPGTGSTEEDTQDPADQKNLGRPKKPVDPEKAAALAAKEKERLEKKAAKAEREKKAQAAEAKSRSLMANFFGKSKNTPTASPSKSASNHDRDTSSPGPTTAQSDFQRIFRPFALKKDAELAPINWFRERKRRCKGQRRHSSGVQGDVIVIDDDEDEKADDLETEDVEMVDAQDVGSPEQLRDVLVRLSPGLNPPRRSRQPTGYKTYNPLPVRGLMSQITEAEVTGDDTEVRRLLKVLRDRRALPAKVLVFTEDARPGYFGTCTRSSREVGPRAPFTRDVVQVDYAYDSGEDWAEEDAGEADDVVEDGEEDGDGDGDADSDMDSWLVDDDDLSNPGTPVEERERSPSFPSLDLGSNESASKRKAKEDKERNEGSKKRRVVVPLVPFAKGPTWELRVDQCAYEPFKSYRIQLLNDTPFPIDPFQFVSQTLEQQQASSGSGPSLNQSVDGFVIPALPPHIAKSSSNLSSSLTSSPSTVMPVKRVVLTPKNAFPDAHLPHLLARIDALATSSLQGIVETVHRELQVHKVKKNAIEAKIKEVGEKCKERKVWVVKADVRAQHGLS